MIGRIFSVKCFRPTFSWCNNVFICAAAEGKINAKYVCYICLSGF